MFAASQNLRRMNNVLGCRYIQNRKHFWHKHILRQLRDIRWKTENFIFISYMQFIYEIEFFNKTRCLKKSQHSLPTPIALASLVNACVSTVLHACLSYVCKNDGHVLWFADELSSFQSRAECRKCVFFWVLTASQGEKRRNGSERFRRYKFSKKPPNSRRHLARSPENHDDDEEEQRKEGDKHGKKDRHLLAWIFAFFKEVGSCVDTSEGAGQSAYCLQDLNESTVGSTNQLAIGWR